MYRSRVVCLWFALCVASASAQKQQSATCKLDSKDHICSIETLLSPQADARPMMRWWWFGVAADKTEILRELKQMKADGIGGVELAFVYPQVVNDPAKGLHNDPFVSPAMLVNVRYAQEQAHLLGLRVDVTLGSGWPYGGPATTTNEAAHRMRVVEVLLPAGANQLPQVKLQADESIISVSIAEGEPGHWSSEATKMVSTGPSAFHGAVEAQNSARTALFFIDSRTKQVVKRASVGAEGWVLDPFQAKAVQTHLKTVGEPLMSAFKDRPPYAIFSDSLEAYGADWTPALPAEFRKRRGYDLLPHLPELVAGGSPAAEAIRHDWGKTLTELVEENYLVQIDNWAKAHKTRFRSQTYGEPAVSLSSQRLVALPEGEGPYWRQFNTLRWATSGNHLYGRNITSAETFTWLHSPVFRATPLDMKAEADLHFIVGTNQIIGHGWPYSPPQVGEPGWSLYAAAVFNDHNPWHPVMPEVSSYIERVSSLLRKGKPANQVALLLPIDDAWASFTPGHVTVTGSLAKMISPKLITGILDGGYNFDFIDAEAIARVGIPYQVVVLPPTKRISIATLRALQAYVKRGGKVMSVGDIPTFTPDGKRDSTVADITKELFNAGNGSHVDSEAELPEALHRSVTPDLDLNTNKEDLGYIRRKLVDGDIYFLANTSNHPVETTASFASLYPHTTLIDPTSGRAVQGEKKDLHLSLAPYESRIVVVSNAVLSSEQRTDKTDALLDLSTGWRVTFSATNEKKTMDTLTDWTSDPGLMHYSGEALYDKNFVLNAPKSKHVYLSIEGGHPVESYSAKGHPGMQAWYEGPVREAAIVMINGKQAGYLWHPPYRLDITKLLQQGHNNIQIRVFNTALNAWSKLPPHDYRPLIEQYGDRFQMQDLNKVQPVTSGIIGRIELTTTQ